MHYFFLILAGLLVSGCVSDAQLAAQAERNIRRKIELYGQACENVGFTRDTDAWRLCVVEYSPSAHH